MVASAAVAVGGLGGDGRWIGLRRSGSGYELVVGDAGRVVAFAPAEAVDVLALAHAYFSEALDPPPVALEATHADVAGAIRWLADAPDPAIDPETRQPLAEALDAIDDGLALDEVLSRLGRAMPAAIGEDVRAYLARRATGLKLFG